MVLGILVRQNERVAMSSRLFEEISIKIRRDLASGQLKPGDKLPPERDLAEQMGVGRPVVREALRALEACGLLEFRKGATGGAFVRPGDAATMTQSISDLIFLGAISLDQLTETRIGLLRQAADLACQRGSEAEFDALDANIEEMIEAHQLGIADDILIIIIQRFYQLLGQAAHNEVLTMMISALSGVIAQVLLKHRVGWMEELIDVRQRIVQKLRARDSAGAAREVTEHLEALHAFVAEHAQSLHTLGIDPVPAPTRSAA